MNSSRELLSYSGTMRHLALGDELSICGVALSTSRTARRRTKLSDEQFDAKYPLCSRCQTIQSMGA